jgi:hypothetical protein
MTTRKKCVIWIWIVFVAAMGIWPPWFHANVGNSGAYALGHRFIFAQGYGRIDISRLLVEWIVATAVAAGLYFAWPLKESVAPPK